MIVASWGLKSAGTCMPTYQSNPARITTMKMISRVILSHCLEWGFSFCLRAESWNVNVHPTSFLTVKCLVENKSQARYPVFPSSAKRVQWITKKPVMVSHIRLLAYRGVWLCACGGGIRTRLYVSASNLCLGKRSHRATLLLLGLQVFAGRSWVSRGFLRWI